MSAEQSLPSNESAANVRHNRYYDLEMVRDYARQGGIEQPVSDEDARAVLDHFACPDELYRPPPDDLNSPEFWAEIERRADLNLSLIDARTVSAYLRQRWGQSQN
jgi:hypothetical protein